jgi:hypothetical protein
MPLADCGVAERTIKSNDRVLQFARECILMTKTIDVTIAALLAAGSVGFTALTSVASSAERQITSVTCADQCPAIFQPVRCKMSDGKVRTFGNSCEASVFACKNRLKIIYCRNV